MSKESFRRDLRRAFDEITGSPSPSLSGRVRSRLDEPVEQRAPMWAAGLAAALIATIVIGVLVVVHPFNRQNGLVGGASPTPSVVVSPSPGPTPFDCSGAQTHISAPPAPPTAYVTDVRVGTHPGFDRITIEFKDALHGDVTVEVQPTSTFVQDASGENVKLAGTYGLKIRISGADEHTDYSGSTDFKPGYSELQEARLMGDNEGVVTWGLGLNAPACYQVTILDNPTRLVIDIQTA